MQHKEYQLQKQICQYLELQYPDVLFLSDTIASCKLSLPQAVRNKAIQKQNFKCPDLIILKPNKTGYGLFIEFKIESIFKKDDETLKSNKHIESQYESMQRLKSLGYICYFAWTFEMAKDMIDDYLK
jgi:hypothetical protein